MILRTDTRIEARGNELGSFPFSHPNYLVVGITFVASFFSFLHIGRKSMWFDEVHSVFFAGLPWSELWAVLSSMEANSGLYYVLLKFWLVFGDSEIAVRALSALFAVASVPVLYALARRLFGIRAGLVAITLLSVNAFFIEYAQEARTYSLALFLVVLSSYLFVRVIEDPSNKRFFYGYVLISAISVYAHFFAALVLLAQTISVPFLPSNKSRIRQLLLADLLIAILLIPIVYYILAKDTGQISWIAKPSIHHLKRLFMDLSGDTGAHWYITGIYLLACGMAIARASVTLFKVGRSMETWGYAFILFWFSVPIAISFGMSLFKPLFVNRFFIVSLPGLVLLAGIGISLVKNKYFWAVPLVLLVIFSVYTIFNDYYPKGKENFRDAVSYIHSNAQRGDGILIYYHHTIIPFEYYWNKLDPSLDIANCVYPSKFGQYKYLGHHSDLTVPYMESLKDTHARIWVFIRKGANLPGIDRYNNFIKTTLEKHYKLKQEKKYDNLLVLQFEK